jgi:hypothetical protein
LPYKQWSSTGGWRTNWIWLLSGALLSKILAHSYCLGSLVVSLDSIHLPFPGHFSPHHARDSASCEYHHRLEVKYKTEKISQAPKEGFPMSSILLRVSLFSECIKLNSGLKYDSKQFYKTLVNNDQLSSFYRGMHI